MKNNKYSNIMDKDIINLDRKINKLISEGCKAMGNVQCVKLSNGSVWWIQTVTVDDDSNNSLGVFNSEPEYFAEVRDLAVSKKLAAVKLLMEKSGMGLKDSKDWVDENCQYVFLEFIQNKRAYFFYKEYTTRQNTTKYKFRVDLENGIVGMERFGLNLPKTQL